MSNFTFHQRITLKNRYTCGCGSVLQKCSLIAHEKTEKHINYLMIKKQKQKQKKKDDQMIKRSVDELFKEKMMIMQNMIDKLTVIQRFICNKLKRKKMDTDHEESRLYTKKSRKN